MSAIRERIKRLGPIVRYYQRKYPSESTCYHCGLPWSAVQEIHFVNVDDCRGFFACCKYCWQRMDDLEKIDAVLDLSKKMGSCSPYTEEEMLDALAQDLKKKVVK